MSVSPCLVVECPSQEHMASLITNEEFIKVQNEETTELIVHMTPPHLIADTKYQAWIQRYY